MSFLTKLFGDPNAKLVKALRSEVEAITAREADVQQLTDEELRAKTVAFRARLAEGATVEDIAGEAFAVVREASKRVLGQRQFDVQLMGGLVLHRGMIAEMRTGEGKTLTAVAPTYLNALVGKGVHVVTVNDYLAKRDAGWMGRIHAFLGLTVGCIQHESGYVFDATVEGQYPLRTVSRKDAYAADVTYGTNNEFGFDYLRDNMAQDANAVVQRPLAYAIVDEVDSILIDEARTPLIISAPAAESADTYYQFADIVKHLEKDVDYNLDEKLRSATFTEVGLSKMEKALGVENLYAEGGLQLVHHAEQALKAHALFLADRDYIVREGEVMIVDEFTGRVMEGRRYSEGLHQAIEAKEGVKIQRESRTLATITYQNYFRLYGKLAGMTGTASTEAEEFSKIYKLEVVEIPTHRENRRIDHADRIYKSEQGKWLAVVQEVKARHEQGQPVLVGTVSVDKNQRLSQLLHMAGVPHEVLNAKNHEREAEIIVRAGQRGAVTVATNMAGRGVDILLGEGIADLGGLHVIGTERHESRRIDNQLRGRSARQGDPGSTQFFVSMEDDLMRIFGTNRVKSMMDRLGFDDAVPIESKMLTGALQKAQERVEGHHFDTRKHVLEYDDVLNKHRLALYERRRKILLGELTVSHEDIMSMLEREIEHVVFFHTGGKADLPDDFTSKQESGDWDPKEILETLATIAPLTEELRAKIREELKELSADKEQLARQRTVVIEAVMAHLTARFAEAVTTFGDLETVQRIERNVLLRAIDAHWMRHLDEMTYLRHTIGLRGYAQQDPLVEYKRESFRLYGAMLDEIQRNVAYNLFKLLDQAVAAKKMMAVAQQAMRAMTGNAAAGTTIVTTVDGAAAAEEKPAVAEAPKAKEPQRNDPCHCGSGKKYKKCHGAA